MGSIKAKSGPSYVKHIIVVMEFIHDDLTQIKNGLPKIDVLVHYNTGLSQLTPRQVLPEDDCQFEVHFITFLRYAFSFSMSLMSLCFLMFSIIFLN